MARAHYRWALPILAAAGVAAWAALSGLHAPPRSVSVALAAPGPAPAIPDEPGEWRGRIDYAALDRQIAALAARPEMAGLAVAVVEEGRLSFVGTYGTSDRTTGRAITPLTVFRWASLSKTATGVLAASAAAEGAVDLSQPISRWGTSLRLPGGAEAYLTLDQLLSQQSGLTKNAFDEKLEDGGDPALLRRELATAPQQCLPGTCHTYQNVAFDAASEILGKALRQPLADSVEARLFRPLGMVSARYGMAGLNGAADWARPHRNGQPQGLKDSYWRVPAAAGAESNILDLAIWMQAMMGGAPNVLPPSVLTLAHTPRVATPALYSGDLRRATADAGYALGWRSFTYQGRRLAGHSGAVAGYRATMIFEPASRTGVVAMWNSEWGIPFRIPFAALDSYHRAADSRWLDLSDIPLNGAAPPPAAAPDTAPIIAQSLPKD